MLEHLWLIPLGFFTGFYGTLVGIGGGFILLPTLLLLYPQQKAEFLTSISLAVVFINSLSGTIAYARMKRISYRLGLLLAVGTVPGAIIGTNLTHFVPRSIFDPGFGVLLLLIASFLFFKTDSKEQNEEITERERLEKLTPKHYIFGITLSVTVGIISSLFGIGGGFVLVPVMIYIFHFSVHKATATSHFILVIMALTGTISHGINGTLLAGLPQIGTLALGIIAGAQLGAHLSNRIHGQWIMRGLATALLVVGLRFVLAAFK